LQDSQVYVSMLIDEEYLDRIRKDGVVTIQTQGLLGDKFLSVSIGTGPAAPSGSTLSSTEEGDISGILEKAGKVVDNTVDIPQRMADFMQKFQTDTLDNVTASVKSLSAVLHEVEKGNGLVHDLVYSKETGKDIVKNLGDVSKNLSNITGQVEK